MGLMIAKLRKFGSDESGLAMILVSIMLPVLIGFALLVIDGSRAGNLHNDTQRGADALAIAAAAELDGGSDAWTRAELALENLVDNSTRFSDEDDGDANPYLYLLASTGTPTVNAGAAACRSRGTISWCFLKSIPASDAIALNPTTGVDGNGDNHRALDAGETQFIMVTVTPQDFTTIFPASFLGGSNSMTIGATAVAGFHSGTCEITPMFMCNPFESTVPLESQSFRQAFVQGKTYSREFRLLKTDAAPGPGNFGLLDTTLDLRTAFATGNAGTCYLRTEVETKPGVTLGQVNSGLNVRFDIYSGSMKQFDNLSAYRPASNVRKGASKSSNCNKFASADDGSAMGFPAGTDGTYTSAPGMSGDGWDRAGYWGLNHGTTLPTIPSISHPTSTTANPSRYDVYRYEIAQGRVGDHAGQQQSGETGTPQCYKGSNADITPDPDRRLFNIAVVNCIADADKINGHIELRPDTYARVFLTNPIEKVSPADDPDGGAAEKPIRLEIVDIEGPGGRGTLDKFFRDEAQLYR